MIPPTIVSQPRLDSAMMQEEIFGPILPVLSVPDAAAAVEFINSRARPLALYVFSADEARGNAVV